MAVPLPIPSSGIAASEPRYAQDRESLFPRYSAASLNWRRTVALPPLVEPADELSIDEVRRYSRHLIIPDVGMDGQKRLKNARVLGDRRRGLGSPALLYLARGWRRHARHRRFRQSTSPICSARSSMASPISESPRSSQPRSPSPRRIRTSRSCTMFDWTTTMSWRSSASTT